MRVCIIGLDCLSPDLVFGDLAAELPVLGALCRTGISGRMQSTVPPITVPAWTAMVTGRDPGALGIYGFRDRTAYDYQSRRFASSLDVTAPTLWSLAGRAGLRSRVIGVPQTHPPQPIVGALVSDAPAAESGTSFTYPADIAAETLRLAAGDLFGVVEHRQLDRRALLASVREATAARFRLARAWLEMADWQLFMLVDMGADRIQHAFWGHDRHLVHAYYRELDREVGTLVERLRADDVVLVVSDHGAQVNAGGFALNEWLIATGYLRLREGGERHATPPAPLRSEDVDWAHTSAWAEGGFVGRIYLNVAGREPHGTVTEERVAALKAEISERFTELRGPDGTKVSVVLHDPTRLYSEARGVPPDLMVELDGYAYRALGTLGHRSLWVRDNDTGLDEANHAPHGVLILRDGRGERPAPPDLSLYDVAPTVLDRLGVARPEGIFGRVL